MSRLDRSRIKALRTVIQESLDNLEIDDIKFTVGNASFDRGSFTFKLEGVTVDSNGELYDPEANTFKQLARYYSLSPEDLGKIFTSGGEQFRITGLNPRRKKYPISATRVLDDKRFKFGTTSVINGLKLQAISSGE